MQHIDVSKNEVVNITINEAKVEEALVLERLIVVVDDDPLLAKMNSLLLDHYLGVKTISFTSPCAAFTFILENQDRISGLITDTFMYVPGCGIQTGIDLVEKLLQMDIDIPVVFCTSLTGNTEKMWMMEKGFYIEKPLEPHIKLFASHASDDMALHLFFKNVKKFELTHKYDNK